MKFTVYLSGEIHTNWRNEIQNGVKENNLEIEFVSAVTDHDASDAAGDCLGEENKQFWRDHKSAKVNVIRTKTLIEKSDLAVIRFGEKYKQWNAAFDAGYCAATGTPYVTLHADDIVHPLKEVEVSAMAWTKQLIRLLKY